MKTYEASFTAAAGDIDELGHVNNAVWVRWIQEVATAHWYEAATSGQVEAYFWVITRHEIDYLRPLLDGETAQARTWVGESPKGARFDRLMEFTNANGKLLVKARTTWAIVEKASGRPVRVPAQIVDRFL